MIQLVVQELSKIDNTIAKKLSDIYLGKQTEVASDFYENTLFETQENYDKNKGYINGQILGALNTQMVDTPLVFLRGKDAPVFFSDKNQGIAFGVTLVDYRSKKPLIIAVMDKVADKYQYKSIKFENGTYIDSGSSDYSCENINELHKTFCISLNADINKWLNKY